MTARVMHSMCFSVYTANPHGADVVFLLRTHIRFEGKFRDLAFTIEQKSADSQALSDLLNKL